jgi:hypothetical protein
MEGPAFKKTKEPPKRANHKGREHRVFECPLVAISISNNERGEPLERMPSLEKSSPNVISYLKIEIACTCCNATDTLCL